MFPVRRFVVGLSMLLSGVCAMAQSSIRDPHGAFDSAWNEATDNVGVAAGHGVTLIRKFDGSIQQWGGSWHVPIPALPPGVQCVEVAIAAGCLGVRRSDGALQVVGSQSSGVQNVPALPAGVVYIGIAVGYEFALGLRSDGVIVAWGNNQQGVSNVPPLPAGLQYVEVAASAFFNNRYGVARRSNGSIVTWGGWTGGVPALPAGATYTAVRAGHRHIAAVRSDGELVCWGDNSWGQCNVPPLPTGVQYVQAAPAQRHTVARRSDGVVVAFGDNLHGQCNVPALPPGLAYVDIAAGGCAVVFAEGQHSVALRSDGRVIAWGDNTYYQCNAPTPPVGVDHVEVAGTGWHQVARLGDGTVVAFGNNDYGDCNVPPLPTGVTYVEIEPRTARRSDGQIVAWGGDAVLLAVPALPPGISYVAVAEGERHALGLRNDGRVVAWGSPNEGQLAVPVPPLTSYYVEIAAGGNNSMARRNDGAVVVWGDNTYGQCSVPPQVSQRQCVQIACGNGVCLARCSDGSVLLWGNTSAGYGVPGLPFGVTYVGMSSQFARRSDGTIVALRNTAPVLPPVGNGSYLEVRDTIVRVGPTSTYVSFAPGCSGSRPATRLVPLDTPRLGAHLDVTLFDLPVDVAIVLTGLSITWSGTGPLPLPLGAFGMPGCTAFVAPDHALLVTGQNHEAQLQWMLPNASALLGARFHQQAFVPDPAAGNPLQAVMSDATTAVVGR